MNIINKVISNYKIIAVIFLAFAIFSSLQSYLQKEKTFGESAQKYTHYNNYIVFKNSYTHLKEYKDLYQLYPQEHWDLYKYSPSFAVFMAAFAVFPDSIGLILWNVLNAFIFLFAVYYLPLLNKKQKGFVLLICLIELMTSMQNSQSNALLAGLIILTFGLLEKRSYLLATFFIVFSVFIKLFGVVALVLFLFYPKKWKLALFTVGWSVVLFILPLLLVDFDQLKFLYYSWGHLLSNDHSISSGFSVIGWVYSWFGYENKLIIMVMGVLLFLIPLLKFKHYSNYTFRFLTLTSILIWIVIFNHKAESPTFIIAMAGIALWFITSEKSILNIILFTCAFILTSLSPTDLFPKYLREEFVIPFMLKVFPCILVWLKIIYELMLLKTDQIENNALQKA